MSRVESLLEQMSQQLDSSAPANPDSLSDKVKELLDLIKHDADNQHQLNVDMATSHSRYAEEVVASIAVLNTLKVDEVKLVEATLGNFP